MGNTYQLAKFEGEAYLQKPPIRASVAGTGLDYFPCVLLLDLRGDVAVREAWARETKS